MDDGSWLFYILLLLLILCGGYFAASEIAFASVSRIRIKAHHDNGDRRAKRALYVLDNFDKALTTLLIGNNLAHIFAASLATVLATRLWGLGAVAYSTIVTTLIVFFFSEMLPKTLAKKYSESFSLWAAGTLYVLMFLFTPFSFLLTALGRAGAKRVGGGEDKVTEDELYDIIENIKEEGGLEADKGELVHSALLFADVKAKDILTFRTDVAAIDADSGCEAILETIKSVRHSRLPVYRGSIDNIIGTLQIRRYMKAYLREGDCVRLEELLDKAYFFHNSTDIDDLLPEMSRLKINMGIVTDDYGGTLGIITIEDILEEIVGEIWDEEDVAVESIVSDGLGGCYAEASATVADVFEFIGFEEADVEELHPRNMGAWLFEQVETIPEVGDSFRYKGLEISVARMDGRRIVLLQVCRIADEGEEGDAE